LNYKINVSRNAQKNLEEIVNFIMLDSKERARSWLKSIKTNIQLLKTNPRMGRKVPEYQGTKEIREIILGNYRIIYEFDGKEIFILLVYHGARLLKL